MIALSFEADESAALRGVYCRLRARLKHEKWNIEHNVRDDTLEDAMAALKACWESADVPIKWPPA